MQCGWSVQYQGEEGPIVTSRASLCSRMEKLGSEVATLFTHSHVVSLVVSSWPSPFLMPFI